MLNNKSKGSFYENINSSIASWYMNEYDKNPLLSWITDYQNTLWIAPLLLYLPAASHFWIGTYSRIKTNRLPHTLSSAWLGWMLL